jgi:hypothetical protein
LKTEGTQAQPVPPARTRLEIQSGRYSDMPKRSVRGIQLPW